MKLSALASADRALAFSLVRFGLIWVVGGLLFVVLDPLMTDIFASYGTLTSTSAASEGQGYIETAWEFAPFVIALIGLLQILAAATLERRAGGRV